MFQIASAVEHATQPAESHTGLSVVPLHLNVNMSGHNLHIDTLVSTWFVMALVIICALILTKTLKMKPDKKQVIGEFLIEFIEGILGGQISRRDEVLKLIPYIGTIFVFILFSNWFGLIPWKLLHLAKVPVELGSPTNDLNTTVGLALISLISYFYYGIKKKGFGYFKHYLQPYPFFLPLNIMEDFTRPLSLAFRLFGNIIGGEIVIAVLLLLVPWFVPLPMFFFEVFVGFIQAFIFAILTTSYIAAAIAEHHNQKDEKLKYQTENI